MSEEKPPKKKLKSYPLSFRISGEAYQALKLLEGLYDKSRKDIVSYALVRTANAAAVQPPIQYRQLDAPDLLALQGEVRELEKFAKDLRRDLLRVRPSEKPTAEKIVTAIQKAEHTLAEIATLRQKIAKMNDPEQSS